MDLNVDKHKGLIVVEDLSYSYGMTKALIDVSFSVSSGDFIAIIGPNGSGKTTLLKIILGEFSADKGKLTLLDQDIKVFDQWHRIGYVPQKATHIDKFFPISVNEVVSLGLLSSKKGLKLISRTDQQVVDRALESVDMLKYKKRRIGDLSGGQQQRVFIARAIVNNPDLLFLDEPTTGVDIETQDRFYEMLGILNKDKGITIVIITHDVAIVNKHVNKVACLNQRLIFHGSHHEFCSSPRIKEFFPGEHHLVCHRH